MSDPKHADPVVEQPASAFVHVEDVGAVADQVLDDGVEV